MRLINLIGLMLLLTLCSFDIKAQNINDYYFKLNEARKLAENRNLDSAIIAYENAFEKARKEGKIELGYFAMIQDRHLSGEYTIQKYWMWPYVGRKKLQFEDADIPGIIKLRASIGLYDLGIRQEQAKLGHWKLINFRL